MNKESKRKRARIDKNGMTVGYSRDEIEELLPNLAEELKTTSSDPIESGELTPQPQIRTPDEVQQATRSQYDTDSELYSPKTEDFLRRCSSLKEAEEIIEHQIKMKEITKSQAEELLQICKEQGIRFFGSKKEWGYYEKTYRK
jgi:hypothetical protein